MSKYEIAEQHRQPLNKVLFRLTYFSTGFFLLFLAQLTYLQLVSQIYEQLNFHSLGNISVLITYTIFGVSSFISPPIVDRFSLKWLIVISSIIFTIQAASGAFVTSCANDKTSSTSNSFFCSTSAIYVIAILINAITGFFCAIVWCCQSGFMDFYSTMHKAKEGLFISIFWAIFTLSQGIGAILAYILLDYCSPTEFFITMAFIGVASCIMFCFHEDIPSHLRRRNSITTNTSPEISAIQMDDFIHSSHNIQTSTKQLVTARSISDKPSFNLLERMEEFKNLLVSKEIRPYLSFFFMDGVVIAFYSTVFYTIIQSSLGYSIHNTSLSDSQVKDINVHSAIIYTALGFSEVLAGSATNSLLLRIDYKNFVMYINAITFLGLFFSFLAYITTSYTICFIAALLWGASDCMTLSVGSYICQVKFNGTLESFCTLRLFQSIGVLITIAIHISLDLNIYYFLILLLVLLAVSATLNLNMFKEEEEEQNQQKYSDQPTSIQT